MNRAVIQPDNSLYSPLPEFVHWEVEDNTILLEGRFSIQDLKRILTHIEKVQALVKLDDNKEK